MLYNCVKNFCIYVCNRHCFVFFFFWFWHRVMLASYNSLESIPSSSNFGRIYINLVKFSSETMWPCGHGVFSVSRLVTTNSVLLKIFNNGLFRLHIPSLMSLYLLRNLSILFIILVTVNLYTTFP
jgi:hypothetical protein